MSSFFKKLVGSKDQAAPAEPGSSKALPGHQDVLPPGQVWGKKYVIYSAFGNKKVNPATWKLRVIGLVNKPLEFSLEEFERLPMKSYAKSFFCLPPDVVVYANPEPLRIADVQEGTKIIGSDGRAHRVRNVISRQHDGELICVKASYLPPVKMTPDHPVWAITGHPGVGRAKSHRRMRTFEHEPKPVWKRADELRRGDYVFFPRYRCVSHARWVRFNDRKIPLNEDLAELLGWYVAEGSGADSEGRGILFALNASEVHHAKRVMSLMASILGSRTRTYSNARGTDLRVVATTSKFGKLTSQFKAWCGVDGESKRIPEFILNANQSVLKSFLTSYLHGDGYSPVFKGKNGVGTDFIDLTTSSKTLAYQLLLAFSKIGVAAEMVNHRGSVNNGHSVRVRGKEVRGLIPNFPVRKKIDKTWYKKTGDGFYYPITRIWKEAYSGTVYDFQAPGYAMLSPFVTQDCVTRWSIENPSWEGVPIKLLAEMAGVRPEATWVMFRCYDGYTAPVPLEDAVSEDAIVALKMNGVPLLPEQGFPARPFIPQLYGWKSAKWLGEIEFMPDYRDGYWEMYGYHERANIWEEERFKGDGEHRPVARRAFGTV